MMEKRLSLVLLRHSHSEWNLSNRFTGWSNIPLTETGLTEATAAGRRLKTEGIVFDEAHISVLQRTCPPEQLPATESLADCQQRTLTYWHQTLTPRLLAGARLLIVSHGNTIRGLVIYLEQLDPAAIEKVEIPTTVPLLYHFNNDLELLGKQWLE